MEKIIYTDSFLNEQCVGAVLPNGLKVFVIEKPDFNSAYAIFGTHYGSIDTRFSCNGDKLTDVPAGIAHYLEHKLFESEDGDAFDRFAKTGASANAFTSFDRTCYLFSCSGKFYENLDILLDFVQTPYFTEKTVEKEQGIIGQEIRMYDDSAPWCVLFNMLGEMYYNHPVKIDIAGTVESISEITAELLYNCYKTFYNPSNMFVCVAGNVSADRVIETVEKSIRPCEPISVKRGNHHEPDEIISDYIEMKMPVSQPLFCFGFKEICNEDRTLFESICSEMLLDIIAGEASPLYEQLINDGLINDEFSSEYFQGYGYAAPIFQGESRDPKAVAKALTDEIERLKHDGIDDSLFESVRRSLYGAAIKRYNNVDSITAGLVDCAMSDFGPFDDLKSLRELKKSDVEQRLSLLHSDRSVLSVIMPNKEN